LGDACDNTTIFFVAADGSDANDGNESAPFKTFGKARDVLGFEADTTLSEMLDEIIPWIAKQIEIGGI